MLTHTLLLAASLLVSNDVVRKAVEANRDKGTSAIFGTEGAVTHALFIEDDRARVLRHDEQHETWGFYPSDSRVAHAFVDKLAAHPNLTAEGRAALAAWRIKANQVYHLLSAPGGTLHLFSRDGAWHVLRNTPQGPELLPGHGPEAHALVEQVAGNVKAPETEAAVRVWREASGDPKRQ